MATQRINIKKYEESIILHFGSDGHKINAYTLASSLVAIADALKEANAITNPGYEVEVVVEAFGQGSFRAKVRTIYSSLNNLFDKADLKAVVLSVLASFIYQHTLAPTETVNVIVNDDNVIIEAPGKTIVVPRTVYDAQKEVEKSERFKTSVSKAFAHIEADKSVTSFGLTAEMSDKLPDLEIPRDRFALIARMEEDTSDSRVLEEVSNLQIKKAILERSKRKWEFVWRGIKISAPVTDQKFYNDFFAHKIKIAPGDQLEVLLKIYQIKDQDTGIFTNSRYEVVNVRKHIPRAKQTEMPI